MCYVPPSVELLGPTTSSFQTRIHDHLRFQTRLTRLTPNRTFLRPYNRSETSKIVHIIAVINEHTSEIVCQEVSIRSLLNSNGNRMLGFRQSRKDSERYS